MPCAESGETGKEQRGRKCRNSVVGGHFWGVGLAGRRETAHSGAFRATQVTRGKGSCDDPGSSSQGAADTQRQLIVATKERQLWLKIF